MPSTLSCSGFFTFTQACCTRRLSVPALCIGRSAQELNWASKGKLVCIHHKRDSSQVCCNQAPESSGATASPDDEDEEPEAQGLNMEALEEFAELNLGAWGGHFLQFDASGKTLQRIPTVLRANTYGRGTDVALLQTLNIKQPRPHTRTTGESEEPMWADYKLDETNLFTVERRQQIGYFPGEKAYCLSHQTAEILEKVLRAGVLGDDDDEDEEYPL